MRRVLIFDTTLRDGEQSPGASMTPPEKLRLAHQLDSLGVDIIEAGFPASSPADFDSVQEIAAAVRRPLIAGLARATQNDIERAAAALKHAERSRLHIFLATSEIHLRYKLRLTREQCLARGVEAVRMARPHFTDVEFSAEDATRTDVGFLCEMMSAVIEAGATTINVPDTVGYAHPAQIRRMVEALHAHVRGIERVVISVHCHDDLGLAVANSLAGIEAGAGQVECTINGIGERAGNAALEEIVMALRTRHDVYPYTNGIDTTELYRTSQLLTHITGIHPQPNKAIVGRNAFAHEAGIHQDGVIKEKTTYEIMTPESVGARGTSLVLGKHSGRHALSQRLRQLGFELTEDETDRAYALFKLLADTKKTVLDEDLIAILQHGPLDDVPHRYRLRALEVVCGARQAAARLTLADRDTEREAVADGDGPIAAAFAAVDALVEQTIELNELHVQSITPGRDSVGEVTVHVRVDGKSFTGRGASPDIVNGAVRAYLHAINKAAHAREIEAAALEQASYLWGV
jgi:2-isopropylmalate synthase